MRTALALPRLHLFRFGRVTGPTVRWHVRALTQCGQLLGRWSGARIELLPWVARLELLGHEPPGEGEPLAGRFFAV